jgi:hypothetical protein
VKLSYKKFKAAILAEPLWLFVLLSPVIYFFLIAIKLNTVDQTKEITQQELIGRIAQNRQLSLQEAQVFWLNLSTEDKSHVLKQYVHNKLLTLKAFELGLDQGDTVIEGRLAQKMRMLVLKDTNPKQPHANELIEFYDKNTYLYQDQKRYSFSYTIDDDVKREDLPDNPMPYGHYKVPFIGYNAEQEASRIAGRFGDYFVTEMDDLVIDKWHGPLKSDLAMHWVYLHTIKQPYLYPYDEVKHQVLADWRDEQNEKNIVRYINKLKQQYKNLIKINDEP